MVSINHKVILANGQFSGTSRKHLRLAFDEFINSPAKDTLVLHFHGGLVNKDAAERIADRLLDVYSNAGSYPLFVFWQSGLLETAINNFQEIAHEDVFSSLVERVLQFVLGKLDQTPEEKGKDLKLPTKSSVQREINNSLATHELPFADRESDKSALKGDIISAELTQLANLLSEDNAIVNGTLPIRHNKSISLNPEWIAEQMIELSRRNSPANEVEKNFLESTLHAMMARSGRKILARSLQRFATERDHGIYTTVVEEVARELKGNLVGELAWRLMKKDTADSFEGTGATNGGLALLEELSRIWQAGHKPRIVLIGHSAGSIFICNLLKSAHDMLPPDLRFQVVFLAPACTFELLDQTCALAGDRISGFRSFSMSDDLEQRDILVRPIYPHSLLYFISGIAEESVDMPLVGMMRYHTQQRPFDSGNFPSISNVRGNLSRFSNPWVWCDSLAGPGLNTLSHHHGDFDEDPATLASVAYIIRHGAP